MGHLRAKNAKDAIYDLPALDLSKVAVELPKIDMSKLAISLKPDADAFSSETPGQRVSRFANATSLPATTAGLKPPRTFRPLGLTEDEALQMCGDKNYALYGTGTVFSPEHEHGDLCNRWSHAFTTGLVTNSLQLGGVDRVTAALAGASVILGKEFFYDKHPDPRDMVISPTLYSNIDKHGFGTEVGVDAFADGSFFFRWHTGF